MHIVALYVVAEASAQNTDVQKAIFGDTGDEVLPDENSDYEFISIPDGSLRELTEKNSRGSLDNAAIISNVSGCVKETGGSFLDKILQETQLFIQSM